MQTEFTKCWTCPPNRPGKRVTVLPRCLPTLRVRVPPPAVRFCARAGERRPQIWRASSSCWNAGAGAVNEALRDLSACRACQRFPASCVRREGRRGRVGECLPRRSPPPPTFPPFASHLRLRSPGLRPSVSTPPSPASPHHPPPPPRLVPHPPH